MAVRAVLWAGVVIGSPDISVLHYVFKSDNTFQSENMLFSKEYVGYLARQVTQKLIAGEFIETKDVPSVTAALNNALLE